MNIYRLFAPLALVSLVACGDDKGTTNPQADTSSGADTTAPADTATGPDTSLPPGCDEYGWEPGGSTGGISALDDDGELAVTYLVSYSSDEAVNYDFLNLELLYLYGLPFETGTFAFTTANYADCNLCLILYKGCNDETDTCDATFLAQAGDVEITTNEGKTGKLVGAMRNVKLVEVTVNEDTFESTLVPNGRVWCIDAYPFDVTVIPE